MSSPFMLRCSRALLLASLAVGSLFVVGCGADDDVESTMRAPGGGGAVGHGVGGGGPNVKRRIFELKMRECLDRGGTVVVDDSCPSTTSHGDIGGSIVGKFNCKARDGSTSCINEDTN